MITTAANTCLTFRQLEDYSLNKGAKHERAIQYLHISNCELCACAVNGFTAMPFTLAEVNAIHHQVTVKANAAHANPLIIARVFFAALCVASVFAFYYFADSFSKHKAIAAEKAPAAEKIIAPVIPALPVVVKEKKKTFIPAAAKKVSEIKARPVAELVEIDPLPVSLGNSIASLSDNKKLSEYRPDVIYIYDLKVVDYNELYFNFRNHGFEMKGHTPSFKEGKGTPDYLSDEPVETIAADKVLKSGLALFTKEEYSKAIEKFLLLLENDHSDQNALFYGGICCYHLGKYKTAIRSLEEILKEPHSAFYEEAKWNLALSLLQEGEDLRGSQLLSEIISERGFYAKKASEKLKAL